MLALGDWLSGQLAILTSLETGPNGISSGQTGPDALLLAGKYYG